jgi:hypothetical protein
MEDEALVLLLIEQMRASGTIDSHHGWLHLPEHKAGFTEEQQAIWLRVADLFADEPWWVRDLAKEAGVEESLMRAVLRQAAQQGMITAIVKDRYYRNDRIVAFASMIRDLDQLRGSTCAADFRDTLNVGESWRSKSSNILTGLALPAVAVMTIFCAIRRCSCKSLQAFSDAQRTSWLNSFGALRYLPRLFVRFFHPDAHLSFAAIGPAKPRNKG